MRVVSVASNDDYADKRHIERELERYRPDVLLCGTNTQLDRIAIEWARENDILVVCFDPGTRERGKGGNHRLEAAMSRMARGHAGVHPPEGTTAACLVFPPEGGNWNRAAGMSALVRTIDCRDPERSSQPQRPGKDTEMLVHIRALLDAGGDRGSLLHGPKVYTITSEFLGEPTAADKC